MCGTERRIGWSVRFRGFLVFRGRKSGGYINDGFVA